MLFRAKFFSFYLIASFNWKYLVVFSIRFPWHLCWKIIDHVCVIHFWTSASVPLIHIHGIPMPYSLFLYFFRASVNLPTRHYFENRRKTLHTLLPCPHCLCLPRWFWFSFVFVSFCFQRRCHQQELCVWYLPGHILLILWKMLTTFTWLEEISLWGFSFVSLLLTISSPTFLWYICIIFYKVSKLALQ